MPRATAMRDRVRELVFYLLMIVLVWAVVETAAVAGHTVMDGRIFSLRAMRDRVDAVASRRSASGTTPRSGLDEQQRLRGKPPFVPLRGNPPFVPLRGNLVATGSRADMVAGRWTEVIHPYFGVVLDPYRHPVGAVSDLGFRDGTAAEALLQPAPGTTVIGIFGGSFAGGIYRESAETVIDDRFAFDCSPPGRPCGKAVTVNFAKGGYKQPQQLIILAYLLALGARFDVVVNIDGFNEVALPPAENVPLRVNPFYPRKWHLKARSVLDPEAVRHVGYLEYLEHERSRRAGWLLEHGLYRSAVAALVWRALDRRLTASILDARQQVDRSDAGRISFRLERGARPCLTKAGVPRKIAKRLRALRGRPFVRREQLQQAVVGRVGAAPAAKYRQAIEECTTEVSVQASYAAFGPQHVARNEVELYRDLAGMWQRSSLEMKALCEAYGVRYYHFLQPNQYLPGSKPMTGEERRIAINPAQKYRWGVVRGYPLLRESGRQLIERGVAFTDLTMIFAHDSEVLYADDCCHLNQQGYAAVLDRILETIVVR